MHRTTLLRSLALTPIAMICITLALRADTQLGPRVIASGGGSIASASHEMRITISQSIMNRTASSEFYLGLGFWEQVGAGSIVSIPEDAVVIANCLLQNAPNPFNPSTTIRFTLAQREVVCLDLFDLNGRRLERILNESREAGEHSLDFRPRNLASGVYLLRMRAGDYQESYRIVLLK